MSKSKKRNETDEETFDRKEEDAHVKYLKKNVFGKDSDVARKYDKWLKEHTKKLRRLEREALGEFVPGDYDASY